MLATRPSALDWLTFALLIVGRSTGAHRHRGHQRRRAGTRPVFRPEAAELVARVIYALIGLAGLYFFYPLFRLFNRSRST